MAGFFQVHIDPVSITQVQKSIRGSILFIKFPFLHIGGYALFSLLKVGDRFRFSAGNIDQA